MTQKKRKGDPNLLPESPKPYSIPERKPIFMIAENIVYGGKEIIMPPPPYVD